MSEQPEDELPIGVMAGSGPHPDPPPHTGEEEGSQLPDSLPRVRGRAGEGGERDAGDAANTIPEECLRLAEALVFASDRALSPSRLTTLLPEGVDAHGVLAALAARYDGRGVVLVEVAGGFAFRTAPDLAARLTRVIEAPRRLPRAAMEALSIIAYHQPVTRAEIEEIRGATLAQSTVESLLELGLVAPRGRRETPGRPTLWGTTPRFLEQFGLKALSDLPRREELISADSLPQLPLSAPEPATAEPDAPRGT